MCTRRCAPSGPGGDSPDSPSGLIGNPGAPNSDDETAILGREVSRRGLKVVAQSVANSGEVLWAAPALLEQKVEAFVKIVDNATTQPFSVICRVGLENRIPVRSGDPPDCEPPGCLAMIGWNDRDDGLAAGRLAVPVLKGESPATMALEPFRTTDQQVSEATAKAIGVSLPPAVRQRADRVVR